MNLAKSFTGLAVGAVLLTWGSTLSGQVDPERLAPDETVLPSPMHCPVEGHEVTDRRYGIRWNGKRYYMGTEVCQEKFMENPELFASEVEPRAALFQSQDPSTPRFGMGVLWAAVLVVFGFLTGAGASYIAVEKGYSGWPWFATGFVLSVFGIALVAMKPQQDMPVSAPGLRKIPATHGPRPCPQCDTPVHPATSRCTNCGQAIDPLYESETNRA